MSANTRVGGILLLKIDGQLRKAKGDFDYDVGVPKREAVMGADGWHGFTEKPKVAFLEGAITDDSELDVKAFQNFRDGTATLELANGKVIVYRNAYYAGDGKINTAEGEMEVRIESEDAEEIS